MGNHFSRFLDGTASQLKKSRNIPADEVPVDPPTPKLYPRHHLLGLPPEVRNLIYNHVFDRFIGANSLKPLLTCRQLWYEANALAWSRTAIDLTQVKTKRLAKLAKCIPSTVASRKVFLVRVSGKQLKILIAHKAVLPTMKVLYIARSRFQPEDKRYWYRSIIEVVCLRDKADFICASPDAFNRKAIGNALRRNAEVAAALAAESLKNGTPCLVPLLKFEPESDMLPEHYMYIIDRFECRIFSMPV